MRLLFVVDKVLPVGASGIALQQLAEALRRGHEVHLLTSTASKLEAFALAADVTVHRVPTLGEAPIEDPDTKVDENVTAAAGIVGQLRPDLTVVHNFGRLFDNRGIARLDELSPLVAWLHDEYMIRGFHFEYESYDRSLLRSFEPWADRSGNQASHIAPLLDLQRTVVVCPSRWLANRARETLGERVPVRAIPNGVDTGLYAGADISGAAPGVRRIVCVGDPFDPRKGMVDAFRALSAGVGSWLESLEGILILGNVRVDLPVPSSWSELMGADAAPAVATTMGQHGVADAVIDRIRLGGWIADPDVVARLLGSADLCLHFSRAENLPTVCIEAQLAGLDVVATDAGGTAETLADPDGLVPLPVRLALATAEVERRLRNPAPVDELRRRAAWARRTFDLSLSFDRLETVAGLAG